MDRFTTVAVLLFLSAPAWAGNYAECILDKMPGTANLPAALAVNRLCTSENPGQYFWIEKGAGRWLFGFDNSEACIIKKSRDTVQTNAAFMIATACRCLYDEPSFKGEPCAYRPQSFVPASPQEKPVAAPTPAATPAPTASPVPRPYIAPAPREPSSAELARQAQVKADLDMIAARAMQDYPFLNTPAGSDVLAKITARRDELIAKGIYPSIALTQAVNAFAPAYAPAPRAAMPQAPVAETPDPPGRCRWITPTKLTCP